MDWRPQRNRNPDRLTTPACRAGLGSLPSAGVSTSFPRLTAGSPRTSPDSASQGVPVLRRRQPPDTREARLGEPTDHSLLRQFRGGSEEAAAQLYARYLHRLQALVRANCSRDLIRCIDVDDIVQSVFGSFFRRASQGLYDVPEGDELWKLILVIALNKIRAKGTYYRAAMRDVRRITRNERPLDEVETPCPERGKTRAFLRLALNEALERLIPSHRAVVKLRMAGYEVAEIAQKLRRSKRTVERVLQEARKGFMDLLGEEE